MLRLFPATCSLFRCLKGLGLGLGWNWEPGAQYSCPMWLAETQSPLPHEACIEMELVSGKGTGCQTRHSYMGFGYVNWELNSHIWDRSMLTWAFIVIYGMRVC